MNENTQKYEYQLYSEKAEFIKYVFKDTKKVKEMLNNFIQQNKIVEEEEFECIVYKIDKEKVIAIYQRNKINVFFLIIYTKRVLTDMPYTTLNECIQIFQRCKYNKREKTVIIPIILTFSNIDKSRQIKKDLKVTTQEGNVIHLKYNVINIKNSRENELFKDLNYIENK